MKHVLSTAAAHDLVEVPNLAELLPERYRALTEQGPLVCHDRLIVVEEAFATLQPEYLWQAVDLHECGVNWATPSTQTPGHVWSRWNASDADSSFLIHSAPDCTTYVFLSGRTEPAEHEPRVRLGDVTIDGAVIYSAGMRHIWSALRQQSDGVLDSSTNAFCPVEIAGAILSAWNDQHSPFWVVTTVAEEPTTSVFAGSGDRMFRQ